MNVKKIISGSNIRDRVEKFPASDGQIACHYTPNPINYDLKNKSILNSFRGLRFEALHGGLGLKKEDFSRAGLEPARWQATRGF
jgi:hypothetical protein